MFETYTTRQGEGPAVVLIHGVGLDHTMWQSVTRQISHAHRVLRYDIIGHGRTPKRQEPLSFDILARQLEDVLHACGTAQAALVGFSLGALIAQAFTLAHPSRVSKLVLLNSAYARNPKQQAGILSRLDQVERHGVASNVKASIDRWFTAAFQREQPEQIGLVEGTIRSNDLQGFLAAYRLFAQSDRVFEGRLHEITVPTLVITGADDIGSTPAMSRAIAAQIEQAELDIFAGAKHMLPVENSDKLSKELIRFLRKD